MSVGRGVAIACDGAGEGMAFEALDNGRRIVLSVSSSIGSCTECIESTETGRDAGRDWTETGREIERDCREKMGTRGESIGDWPAERMPWLDVLRDSDVRDAGAERGIGVA